ncbi:MAG: SDR family oxidoreductase [Chloroflexota bacterium]|nr:SDR family oxidoreductase [Chloroflexota bacterium]
MNHPLASTTVLITGAAGGIGAATARRLAAEGAQLLLADLNGEQVQELGRELGQPAVQVDLTRGGDIQRMVETAYERWDRVDVLFNNAGIVQARPLLDITEDDWDRMLAVNLRAVFFVLQAVARRMVRQARRPESYVRGKLIQTASVAGFRGGLPITAHYAASKAAVISITRSAAQAFAAQGVTSNCICPGVVDTPMWQKLDADWAEIEGWPPGEAWKRRTANIPLGRPEQASDVAGVVAFLASSDSDYMTGQAIIVDGGLVMGN